ncbi:MAG: TlpA disulfide reductase family protein [Bacteroidales bacterium]|nr:TlpA disulfide reductase family protein [Bacteroidales bacterium]
MQYLTIFQKSALRITPIILNIMVTLVSFGPLSSCKKKEAVIPADTAKTMATDFKLKSLSGDSLGLSDYTNKVVVLFFFGYSCSYCKASAPEIQANLVVPYASRTDYAVLGLDVWNGLNSAVEAFKNSTGVSFPLMLNASAVGSDYGTTNDRLIIVDQTGYIRFRGNQGAIMDIDAAKQKVNELLAK